MPLSGTTGQTGEALIDMTEGTACSMVITSVAMVLQSTATPVHVLPAASHWRLYAVNA